MTAFARAENEDTRNGFLEHAAELGWRTGDNLILEERWTNGRREVMVPLARELARLPVDIILAAGTVAAQAAKQATSTIPIVMTDLASDPVANGLVASLARPGANITGLGTLAPVLSAKRLELLAELVPGLSRVAVWVTPDNPSKPQNVATLQAAADRIGLDLRVEEVIPSELRRAFEATRVWRAQALLLVGDAALGAVRPTLLALVDGLQLPAIYSDGPWVDAGGLMSYAEDAVEAWRRAADYVDKILRGTRPADLPVELPTRFHMAFNLKTAEMLHVTIPPSLAAQVTQWVQ